MHASQGEVELAPGRQASGGEVELALDRQVWKR